MADKKTTKTQERPLDLLDVLLDSENKDPIILMDEKGKKLTFEQVAVIPYGNENEKKLYCVLKPMDKIDGIADDEAIVFLVDEDNDANTILRVEEDEEVAIAVFDKYYDLLEEASKKAKADKKPAAPKKSASAKPSTAAKKTTSSAKPAGKTAGKPKPKK